MSNTSDSNNVLAILQNSSNEEAKLGHYVISGLLLMACQTILSLTNRVKELEDEQAATKAEAKPASDEATTNPNTSQVQ